MIDDGSSDKTYMNTCRNYSNSFENIRLYQNDHRLTKSLNILLEKPSYFIARQDADISASSRLEKQLKYGKV